ncbi:hypothetical protein Tco_0061049, partial [Tanacetum coccineum]
YVERLDRFGSRELNADFSEFILKYMPVKQGEAHVLTRVANYRYRTYQLVLSLLMDEAAVQALLKDQSDALHAELHTQLAALHVELQEIKGIGLTRHGAGGGDSGLPRSIRLEVPKFNGIDPEHWIFAIHEYFDLLERHA